MAAKPPKSAKKSATVRKGDTAALPKPALIPRPDGRGALLTGGMPGNRGNKNAIGRPPSAIREYLRGSIGDRVGILEAIMDGEPMRKIDVPFMTILQYAKCPACQGKLTTDLKPADMLLLTIEGKVSASPRDRIGAWETAARYGLGALKEVSVDAVTERLNRTLDKLQELTSAEQYARIVKELQPIWS